jgi:SAM-dependent methyltransferase
MGRRDIPVADEEAWVFHRLAGDYRGRPPYPSTLVDRLAALAGPGARVADLGAGVGHLALPLARRGLRVDAVEPARAMREALAAAAGELPVTAVAAAAEETGLPAGGFALVLIADALHWLDPERAGAEVGRLLARGGAVAVVEAAPADTPFMRDLSALLEGATTRRPPPGGRLRQLLSLAGAGGRRAEGYRQEALLDGPALDAVLRSFSHVGPALGPSALERLLGSARDLAARHGGARWERELTLTWARRAA